jgi:SAM-dependent methyltransferase
VSSAEPVPYVLGMSERERSRVVAQSEYLRPITEDALRRAGIGPGMDVLDVGTGGGGVALAAAELVGPGGSVTALDSAPEMLEIARARAAEQGLTHVRFVTGDVTSWECPEPVDAVVGRLILMHVADPAATVARLAGYVRPGGVVLFQECYLSCLAQIPETPVFARGKHWVLTGLRLAGRDVDIGLRLGPIFRAAGLPSPTLTAGAGVEEGSDAAIYSNMTDVVHRFVDLLADAGLADRQEIDIDTFEERLRRAAAEAGAVAFGYPLISASCRLPA